MHMKEIVLGKTGIKVPQNAFGALPIQRVDMDMAVKLLRRAYDGGMREKIYISSKTMAKTPE